MAMPRKHPPVGAIQTIEEMASKGFAAVGIAKHFGIATSTFRRWLNEHEEIQEAFDRGKETERQALHALLVRDAVANKSANVNAIFLLKARHGYRESDSSSQQVNVAVDVKPVMVVKDFGTDEQWEARAAEQQRRLADPSQSTAAPLTLTAPSPESALLPEAQQAVLPVAVAAPRWKGNA